MTVEASSYVSPEELTLWLTERQNEIYGDMRDAIDMSNERSEMQNDLSTIQTHLEEANKSGDFSTVRNDITTFLATYGEVPGFDKVSGALTDIQATIDANYENPPIPPDTTWDLEGEELEAAKDAYYEENPVLFTLPGDTIATWCEDLKAKSNYLSQQDQLALIQIQELNGDVNQSEQLVSNLIASQNETQGAVISNIRG